MGNTQTVDCLDCNNLTKDLNSQPMELSSPTKRSRFRFVADVDFCSDIVGDLYIKDDNYRSVNLQIGNAVFKLQKIDNRWTLPDPVPLFKLKGLKVEIIIQARHNVEKIDLCYSNYNIKQPIIEPIYSNGYIFVDNEVY